MITLTGHVGRFGDKLTGGTAASRVKGMKALAAEIEVKLESNMRRSDDEIAKAAIGCQSARCRR